MTVTYTGNLKFGLPTTGTESGVWGDVVNNQITTLVDQSISGTVSLASMTNADYTLTNGDGNAPNEARYMAFTVPFSVVLTANRNIIVPSTSKSYIVRNVSQGGFSVTVKTAAGTGVEVPNGAEMFLWCNGTNVFGAFDTINVSTVNGGQLAGLRNKLINGNFAVNQRNYVSGAAVGTALYGHDRWKMAASGDTYTFATTNNKTTVTIPAGKVLQQVIEGASIQAGTYTLSWEGTAQGKIAGGAYGASGITGATSGGGNITVEFGPGTVANAQFEFGSVATAFEYIPYGLALLLCQRYYQTFTVVANTFMMNATVGGITYETNVLQVPMRQTPVATQSGVTAVNGTALALGRSAVFSVISMSSTAAGLVYITAGTFNFSSEL